MHIWQVGASQSGTTTSRRAFPRVEGSSLPFPVLAGGLLALLGGTVILGWSLHLVPLVRALPGFTPMVFNTALSFMVSGTALALLSSESPRHRRIAEAMGAGQALLAALILVEHLAQTNLAIDWPAMHA